MGASATCRTTADGATTDGTAATSWVVGRLPLDCLLIGVVSSGLMTTGGDNGLCATMGLATGRTAGRFEAVTTDA